MLARLKISSSDRRWINALRGKDLHNGIARRARLPDRRCPRLRRQRRLLRARAWPRASSSRSTTSQATANASPARPGSRSSTPLPSTGFADPGQPAARHHDRVRPAPELGAARRRPARPRPRARPQGAPVLPQRARRSGRCSASATRRSRTGRRSSGIRFKGGTEAFLQSGLAGAIGTVEVRPLDLTAAYGAIANGGPAIPPRMILEVRDPAGNVIYKAPDPEPVQAVSSQAAFLVTDILAGNTDPRQNPIWAAALEIAQRPERRASARGGQDRHGQRRPRPRHLRLPRAAGGPERARPRSRDLDGQQRPLVPASASPRPR